MKILFISHSYPPILGGVESQNYNLAQGLSKIAQVKIIANGRGKWWLPVFVLITFIRTFFLMMNYDACLVGNGVLAPLAYALKLFHPKKKFFSVVHGLDITFSYKKGILPKIYKAINIPSLKKLDKLFMVGNITISEAIKIGIAEESCVYIPNGVSIENFKEKFSREDLSNIWGTDTNDKKVILRLARFVPHKGTAWFIENVMPHLPENVVFIATGYRVAKNTAGDPDDFEDCKKAIKYNCLENRVKLMPNLPQEKLKILLNTVDLVVSPNIPYSESIEGFGINVIEAGACQRVVIAANFQGLAEAISNGKNGFLVESENIEQWVKKINAIFSAGPEFAKNFGLMAGKYVEENFTWEKISKRYLEEMEKVNKR